jgi:hypothetical protein
MDSALSRGCPKIGAAEAVGTTYTIGGGKKVKRAGELIVEGP